MEQYQQFIHKSRYARWLPEEGRRETWEETVQRYVDFWLKFRSSSILALGETPEVVRAELDRRCLISSSSFKFS